MYSFNALSSTDTHDGTGYDVRRGDRQVQKRCAEDDDSGVQIGGETVHWLHTEDFAANSADDFPAADGCTERHSKGAEQFYVHRHVERTDITAA